MFQCDDESCTECGADINPRGHCLRPNSWLNFLVNEQLRSLLSAQDLANQIRLSESYKAAVDAADLPAGKYLCPLAAEYISGQQLPFV